MKKIGDYLSKVLDTDADISGLEEPTDEVHGVIDVLETVWDWHERSVKEHLEKQKGTQWALQQRKAIEVGALGAFVLKKQVCFGGLTWKRGSKGFLLRLQALECLDNESRDLLEYALRIPDTKLCSLGDYVYVLPKKYLKFTQDSEEPMLF